MKRITQISLCALTLCLSACSSGVSYSSVSQDRKAPVISAEKYIEISQDEAFDPVEHFTVKDNFGKVTMVVTGNVKQDVPGDYLMTITATDPSGNMAVSNMLVHVNGELPEPETEPVEEETPEVEEQEAPVEKPAQKPQKPVQKPSEPAYTEPTYTEPVYTPPAYTEPAPAPDPTPAPDYTPPSVGNGGSTSCWWEGNSYVCEWVSDWEIVYDD